MNLSLLKYSGSLQFFMPININNLMYPVYHKKAPPKKHPTWKIFALPLSLDIPQFHSRHQHTWKSINILNEIEFLFVSISGWLGATVSVRLRTLESTISRRLMR